MITGSRRTVCRIPPFLVRYVPHLQRVLRDAGVADEYDVLICDPLATESDHLYNAIYATRNLVIPTEPSAKGRASVEGLEQLATNFGDQLNIEIGVLAAVPNGFKHTNDQEELIDEIDLPTPEVIGDRTSMMEGCWKQLHLQDTTLHRQRRVKSDVESELCESVKKADLREAALLVGLERIDDVADQLREWGYDFE